MVSGSLSVFSCYSADSSNRLRVHATQEWNDFYKESTLNDLQLFLDHYLKGKDNGWQNTPRVRASFLRYNKVYDPPVSVFANAHTQSANSVQLNSLL